MDTLNQLMHGFAVAITPINLMWALVGCFLGTAIGVLPGIRPALTVAMLLPLAPKVDPTAALIMFAGIYYGAMFGGSTTSILLNTPGESASIVTALEGNQMAKRGRARRALASALRDLLVRRRHDCDAAAHAARPGGGRVRAALRSGRILLADGARLHDGVDGAGRLGAARPHAPPLRSP